MRRIVEIIAIAVLVVTLLISCKQQQATCYEPIDVRALIGYTVKQVRVIDTLIDSVLYTDTTIITYKDTSFMRLNALSLDVDSPVMIFAPNYSSKIGLFLNPNDTKTTYRIAFDESSIDYDTLTIYHSSFPKFISNNCGYTYFYKINSMTYQDIDSVAILKEEVTTDMTEPIVLFYFFN